MDALGWHTDLYGCNGFTQITTQRPSKESLKKSVHIWANPSNPCAIAKNQPPKSRHHQPKANPMHILNFNACIGLQVLAQLGNEHIHGAAEEVIVRTPNNF